MTLRNLSLPDSHVIGGLGSIAEGKTAMRILLAMPKLPTAVIWPERCARVWSGAGAQQPRLVARRAFELSASRSGLRGGARQPIADHGARAGTGDRRDRG